MRWFIVILTLAVGCTEMETPDRKLVDAYSDIVVVREMYADSAVVKHKNDSILQSYGYDSTEFASSLRSMSRTPLLLKTFFDSVSAALAQKRTKRSGL